MNVNTITIPQDMAIEKLAEYRAIPAAKRRAQDGALLRTYRAAMNGQRVIDVNAAFRDTGLNEKGHPKLAIARASWEMVYFFSRASFTKWEWCLGAGGFSPINEWDKRAKNQNYVVPQDTFDDSLLTCQSRVKSPVPHIPPPLRPEGNLDAYHILFEVESWTQYPTDPFLLKRISGSLFSVVAEWDLTEIEASVLSSLVQ